MRRAALLCASFLAALSCGGPPPALVSLMWASFEPGVGLGSLSIGSTTLPAFLERFPGGRPSTLIGDEIGVEVTFADQGMSFLFMFEPDSPCHTQAMANARELNTLLAAPARLFEMLPACATTTLSSVSAEAKASPETTFYKGSVKSGIALFTLRDDVLRALGDGQDVRGVWLAQGIHRDTRREELYYRSGLYLAVGESTSGPTTGRLVVQQISVFPAQNGP